MSSIAGECCMVILQECGYSPCNGLFCSCRCHEKGHVVIVPTNSLGNRPIIIPNYTKPRQPKKRKTKH